MFKSSANQSWQTAKSVNSVYDEGLRRYLLKVFNYMALALLVTGLVAKLVSSSEVAISALYNAQGGMTGLGTLVAFSPLAFVLVLSIGVERMQVATVQLVFWSYAVVMGVSMAYWFLMFTGESVARVFFMTTALFAGMSLWGYTTKRDLSKFGSFLMMGLMAIVIASLVNLFMQSSAIMFFTTVIGLFVFIGLVAFNVQRLKHTYQMLQASTPEHMEKAAVMGALTLYLDFINIFIRLLMIFGQRRD